MKTFVDLYNFLQIYEENNIIGWLEDKWEGKNKQESLLRLFVGLNLISKLNNYDICNGNFNKQSISKKTSLKDIFYNEINLINLKDKGDSSDLTCISKINIKHLLLTTSKDINKLQVGKLDIDKILTNFQQYKDNDYIMSLCICIRNKDDYNFMLNNIETTNKELKLILEKEDTIIIDWNDLNEAYNQFKLYFKDKSIDNIIKLNKNTLCLKLHQHLSIIKTLKLKKENNKEILWGHIQRSGKSYIMCGCIIKDSIDKDKCNYLIITTAPNETIEQYKTVLDCNQLDEFNIINLNGINKKPILKNKNIIICSKQFLQTKDDKKTKSIIWLKNLKFDIRFIDESHNGGTTELAKKTLEIYGKDVFTIQITATYFKPINNYNIPKNNWILWDLEDIKLCKNINNEFNYNRLIEKHGNEIKELISNYSIDNIINEYSKYPDFNILSNKINEETKKEIIDKTKDNNYGWSIDACFLLKQGKDDEKIILKDEFQNEEENLKIWYKIFGKKDKFGIPDKDYTDEIVFMKRIEKICKNPTIDSRFIGEGDFKEEPMIIMAFLPQNNIDIISKATIKLLIKNKVINDYNIISINSHITNNPKETIEEARIKARNSNKKGVLVLSGRQCSLGVSIENCDIVLLLNNNTSYDMIYQMMFRSMTEGKNKKCGFVVDLSINRVIETTIINYATLIYPDKHPKEAIKYILQEKIINLNADQWMPTFGNDINEITNLCNNIYDIYSSNTINALNNFISRLQFKELLLSKDEQKLFNTIFNTNNITKKHLDTIKKLSNDEEEEQLKNGIEKTKIIDDKEDDDDIKEDKNINYMDILKHIIPLICLLTIHDEETSFIEMFNYIEKNKYIYEILIDQTKSWWGKKIDNIIIKTFINIYIKYMKDDKETNQIIRTVKELFMKNIKNNKELSKLIDKYLIPQELEKKQNAEISTPYELRQEMINKIPEDFWKTPKKVFEPCCGKCGFLLDIIDKFMEGLKDLIEDENERYKLIIEECLYYSDINPTNIFISKILLDPYNEYKLNYNEGNTLKLNIKEKWDIEGFDAVIGNPPYNDDSGNKGKGHCIWVNFVEKTLKEWLNENAYLSYVHPSLWRQDNHPLQKIIKEKQIIYLEIHNIDDGNKIFKCSTRYDWYLIQNTKYKNKTIIKCEDGKIEEENLLEWNYIPNMMFKEIKNISNSQEKINIIHSESSYEIRKKWMSKLKNNNYIHPCIYTINKNNIPTLFYSNINTNGHFNEIKFIFTNGSGFICDYNGEFGITQWGSGIIYNKENLDDIEKCFRSIKFNKIKKAIQLDSSTYNIKVMKYFNKDFYKEFI